MTLAAELLAAYLAGAVSLLVVLAKYGGKIVQVLLSRRLRQVAANTRATNPGTSDDADNWLLPPPASMKIATSKEAGVHYSTTAPLPFEPKLPAVMGKYVRPPKP